MTENMSRELPQQNMTPQRVPFDFKKNIGIDITDRDISLKDNSSVPEIETDYDQMIQNVQNIRNYQTASESGDEITQTTTSKGPSDEDINTLKQQHKKELNYLDSQTEMPEYLKRSIKDYADYETKQREAEFTESKIEEEEKRRQAEFYQKRYEEGKLRDEAIKRRIENMENDWQKFKIRPLRYLANQSAGEIVSNSLAVMLATIRGDNASLNRLQQSYENAVTRDINAQIANANLGKEKDKTIIDYMIRTSPNIENAASKMHELYNEIAILKGKRELMKNPTPEKVETLNKMVRVFEEAQAKLKQKRIQTQTEEIKDMLLKRENEIKTEVKRKGLIGSTSQGLFADRSSKDALETSKQFGTVEITNKVFNSKENLFTSKLKDASGYTDELIQDLNTILMSYADTFGTNPSNDDRKRINEIIKGSVFNDLTGKTFLRYMAFRIADDTVRALAARASSRGEKEGKRLTDLELKLLEKNLYIVKKMKSRIKMNDKDKSKAKGLFNRIKTEILSSPKKGQDKSWIY